MKIKTIQELNEKMWYRIVKILYIFSFVYALIIYGSSTFREASPKQIIDDEKTTVECLIGNKETFTLKEIHGVLWLPPTNLQILNIYDLLNACQAQDEKVTTNNPPTNIADGDTLKNNIELFTLGNGYIVRPVYKTEGGYIRTILRLILSIFILVFIYELIRRIFYYIVFGKIFPNKK